MWPSNQETNMNNNSSSYRAISSSSSSSLSSSSSSSALASSERRGVEEVWKDINVATPPLSHTSTTTMRGVLLQDFLALAFNDTPVALHNVPLLLPPAPSSVMMPPPPPPPPPHHHHPPTALSLDSGLHAHNPTKKRALMHEGFAGDVSVDGRQKRMIKNRESAARSRARKQAYTHELELEIQNLAEENTKLKKQHEQLRMAMAAQLPTKKKLHRWGTAPF